MSSPQSARQGQEPPATLTRSDIVATLEREARARRPMSAADFVAEYRAGRLVEPGEVADLIGLAYLLGDDDPLTKA